MLKFEKGTIIKQKGSSKIRYQVGDIIKQNKLEMVELIILNTGTSKAVEKTYRTVAQVNSGFCKPRIRK